MALSIVLMLGAGCAAPVTPTRFADQTPANVAAPPSPTLPIPVKLTLWHRWPEDQAATLRQILDDYQKSQPALTIEMTYQPDLLGALSRAQKAGSLPDVILMAGDQIAEAATTHIVAPLDLYIDNTWLDDNFIASSVGALRFEGKLWGLPVHVQTLTFIYNPALINDNELTAKTDQLLAKARAYQAAHPGVAYIAYPAYNDVYFSAPWFYGAGAWYAREDGSVGLDTPGGLEAAQLIASLREIVPADIDYGKADAMFRAGQTAITISGPWYVRDLEISHIPYALQIMPIVSGSNKPARPLVTVDGVMLGAKTTHLEEAVRLIAYLAGSEAQLRLARRHGLVPANILAVERAREEGLVVVAHFAHQATLGEAMPTTPYMVATWDAITQLLRALWEGTPPEIAIKTAQKEALTSIQKLKR